MYVHVSESECYVHVCMCVGMGGWMSDVDVMYVCV